MKTTDRKLTNILIVEDSFFFSRWLYAEFFKIEGLEIVGYANNYKDASIMIENLVVDIAIIDIKLEEGYGTNLIKGIKSKNENRSAKKSVKTRSRNLIGPSSGSS